MTGRRTVQGWLLLGALAVIGQARLTTYADPSAGGLWTLVSLVLLWRVYRRGHLARVVFAIGASFGLVVYTLVSLGEPVGTGTVLALLYGVQLAAVLAPPVRAWTRSGGAAAHPTSSGTLDSTVQTRTTVSNRT